MREIPSIYAEQKQGPLNVTLGIPLPKANSQPHPCTVQSVRDCWQAIEDAGFKPHITYTGGNPYISGARAEITRKALDAKADIIVYIDYDVAWRPEDMIKLLTTEGEVVGGTYRCKVPEIVPMGAIYTHLEGVNATKPIVRADGCIKARTLPAGFLKVTTKAIDDFMRAYPELCYGPQYSLSVDLFHHGAHKGIWWGEDYAFCRNYEACGGEIWNIPDLNLDHWGFDFSDEKPFGTVYKFNYHEYLLACPGGSKHVETNLQPVAVGV